MSNYNITELSKNLAYLLRHDKDAFLKGLIDNRGWRKVSELKDLGFTKDILDEILETNNKQRYEYNEDETKVRARQGHSIPVDVELTEATPPDVLYHGTATRSLPSIMERGLIGMGRLYVHLSKDIDTAKDVGKRHGKPCVIEVKAKEMVSNGVKFYLSNNGVWLTKKVPVKYFGELTYFE
jgi:putative RNA 2'-phosphotransferase